MQKLMESHGLLELICSLEINSTYIKMGVNEAVGEARGNIETC